MHTCRKSKQGFTLAELLISLAILGVIATFSIPKILSAQQNRQYNAIAHENIATVAAAYQILQLNGQLTANTTAGAFTPYINYISAVSDSSLVIDSVPTLTTTTCNGTTYYCLKMHNGSVLAYRSASFGGTATTNGFFFFTDPDGKVTDGTTNGPGKGMSVFIYYNGRMTDEGNLLPGTTSSLSGYSADAAKVPSWFSW